MASRKAPFDGLSLWDSVDAIRNGIVPDIPIETPPKFALIRSSCLQKDPKRRPKSSHLCFSLNALLREIGKYLFTYFLFHKFFYFILYIFFLLQKKIPPLPSCLQRKIIS